MKQLSPGKIHNLILTQLSSIILVLFLVFPLANKVSAVCNPGACGGGSGGTICQFTDATTNLNRTYCCTGTNAANECGALISQLNRSTFSSTAPTSTTNSGGGSRVNINPNGSCGDTAIDTALGCLSVETKGFTITLLKFLAGVAGGISLVIMLVATIQIMTGGDNAEQVKKGKELFTSAITGLIFIIFSVTLLRIVAGDIIQLPGFN